MNVHRQAKMPIRVLAVDDSAVMRGVLRTLFLQHQGNSRSALPEMELCGIVEDGMECLAAVLRLRPDLVVLDLEMPRMHGLDVLERLRIEEPGLPVIMCSAHTERGARTTLDALALGAADYVMKPALQNDLSTSMELLASQLLPKIAALAGAGRQTLSSLRGHATRLEAAEAVRVRGSSCAETSPDARPAISAVEIVVIGVSTGGPSALEALLPRLGADFPVPIMVVQHMPKLFTGALAERLDRSCALRVREAHDGAELLPGTIWLAPGDAHMEAALLQQSGANAKSRPGAVVLLHQERALNHCKPSVDYLFSSAARVYGPGTLALVMTGMGCDGLIGARRVHEAGGAVLTQDEATSAVWGMPRRVFEAGISREPLPLNKLAGELTRRTYAGRNRKPSTTGSAPELPAPQTETTPRMQGTTVSRQVRETTHGLL